MKKLMSVICALALVFIAACGGSGSGNTDSSAQPSSASPSASAAESKPAASSGEKKKLSLWFIETGKRQELIEAAVAQFMTDNPDIEVEVVQTPNDPYKTKLSVAMGGGNPPDIFHSWGGGWLKQFVSAGQVLDLTGKIDEDSYIPAALGAATFDGKRYGAPLAMTMVPVFYNKEIFAKHNIEVPTTYTELLEVIDKLNAEKIIPFSMANKTKWPGAFYLMYFANRTSGPEIFAEAFERTGRGFDDEGYVKAGELIQELVNRNAFNPGFNGLQYDTGQSRQLLYTGKAAMEIQTASYINNVRNEAPEFEEKLGIFPFPIIEGGNGKHTDLVGGISPVFSVASQTKYPDEAIELIKAITSLELAQKLADEAGTISAIQGVVYSDPFTQQLNDMLKSATFMQTFYDQTLPAELAELHKDTTQSLFGLSITPEEAAKQMEELAKEILK